MDASSAHGPVGRLATPRSRAADIGIPDGKRRTQHHWRAPRRRPRWITERRIRIGEDEVSLDKLALLIVFILVGMYGILALQYVRTQTVADRNDLAVALVTAHDVAPLRFGGSVRGAQRGQ